MEKVTVRCPKCGMCFKATLEETVTSYTNLNLEREKLMQRDREDMKRQLQQPLSAFVGYDNLSAHERSRNLSRNGNAEAEKQHREGFV